MKRLLKQLLASGIVRAGKGASESDIKAAETELGVKFPGSYRDFLRTVGVLEIDDGAVLGLGSKRRVNLSTVWLTNYSRAWPTLRLPEHYIAIWDDCHEDCECLDTSRVRGRECPIVNVSRLAPEREKLVVLDLCDSLEEWLLLKVDLGLKVKRLLDLTMS